MKTLVSIIAVCLPTFGVAEVLEADKRYLCEAETAFGWRRDAKFTEPGVWVSKTRYVIEPAGQQMKQLKYHSPNVDVEVTHVVKELGKDWPRFCTVAVGKTVECFIQNEGKVLLNSSNFVISLNDNDDIVFSNDNVWVQAWLKMQFHEGKSSSEAIAFEGGSCLSF